MACSSANRRTPAAWLRTPARIFAQLVQQAGEVEGVRQAGPMVQRLRLGERPPDLRLRLVRVAEDEEGAASRSRATTRWS